MLKEAYELGYRGYVGLECSPLNNSVEAAQRVALADRWKIELNDEDRSNGKKSIGVTECRCSEKKIVGY